MKKLTVKDKIALLEELKKRVIADPSCKFMCNRWNDMEQEKTGKRHAKGRHLFDVFPEFWNYKPKNESKFLHAAWFQPNQEKQRIAIINKVINELKAKL